MKRRIEWVAAGCALLMVAALFLASHRSYQPGHLLAAHAQLAAECSACHRPWRGVTNQGCIDCHGPLADSNPHSRIDPTDPDDGLIAGRHLAVFDYQLQCLSCHREHRGAKADVAVAATFACTWCHHHPSIDKVAEHRKPTLVRPSILHHIFTQPFDHDRHRLLIEASYPPRPGGFSCTSCHLVEPVKPGHPERMSLRWSGCTGALCHVTPQDHYLKLPADLGPSPQVLPYSSILTVRHLNAVFVHSAAHLRTPCKDCHLKAAGSRNPSDRDARLVSRCFDCHAHQPAPAKIIRTAWLSLAAAEAAVTVPNPASREEPRVVACGACHLFHSNGMVPLKDFTKPAPAFPPGGRRVFVTLYLPGLKIGELPNLKLVWQPHHLAPWSLGAVAVLAMALLLAGYIAFLEPEFAPQAASDVAPQRGHQVPVLDDTYQTSIRHLYVVGEAAGTASINLAMRSGRQVMQAIMAELRHGNYPVRPNLYQVAIVGCGPAGLAATVTAKNAGLNYLTLEKMTPASTLRSYPRAKFVQATPIDIEEYGSFFLEGDNTREALIEEWDRIIRRMELTINEREEVVDVKPEEDYLRLSTRRGNTYDARFVILAIGVRGNPRHLGLPGEDEPDRVHYNLIEPAEFQNRRILVVGGGNAGAEVAQALAARELGNTVSYSFHQATLSNVTQANSDKIAQMRAAGALTIYPATELGEINPGQVALRRIGTAAGQGTIELPNDVIFAMIGAELPTVFFKSIGIKVAAKGR